MLLRGLKYRAKHVLVLFARVLNQGIYSLEYTFRELTKKSSFIGTVGTVVAVALLFARGSRDVVGIASAGGDSTDSASSLEVVGSSDWSSDSMSLNLGGFGSTWHMLACCARIVMPVSFW